MIVVDEHFQVTDELMEEFQNIFQVVIYLIIVNIKVIVMVERVKSISESVHDVKKKPFHSHFIPITWG